MDRTRGVLKRLRAAMLDDGLPPVNEEEAAAAAVAAKRCNCARTFGNVLLYIAQLCAARLNTLTGTGVGIGGAYSSSGPLATLLQPAGYAFGIWGLLYFGMLAYVIWQALPDNAESDLARRTGWWTLVVWVFLAAWGALASAAPFPDTLAVQATLLLFMLALLRALHLALHAVTVHAEPLTPAQQWCVAAPLSALTAWVTIAALLNAAVVLMLLGASWLSYDAANEAPAAVLVTLLGLLGCVLAFTSRANPTFGVVFIWALIGIVVANARPGYEAVAALAAVSAVAVLVAMLVAMWTVPGPPKWGWPSHACSSLREHVRAGDGAAGRNLRARTSTCCGDYCSSTRTFCGRCWTCWCCAGPLPGGEEQGLLGTPKTGRIARVWRWLGAAEDGSGGEEGFSSGKGDA
jgi:hypothetical protein